MKPQYERLLKGDDAKAVAAVEGKIDEAIGNDDYTTAIKLNEELLATRQRLQGDDHWETIDQRFGLEMARKIGGLTEEKRRAWTEARRGAADADRLISQGRFRTAFPLLEKMLLSAQEVLGDDHPFTSSSLNDMAANLDDLARHAEAQPQYQRALEISLKAVGEKHPLTATIYNNIAGNLNSQGEYAEAQLLFEKALAIRGSVLGKKHPETAASISNVAFNLNAQGRFAKAQPLYEEALALRIELFGEDDLNTAYSYNNLAANLNDLGMHEKARPYYQRDLEICLKRLGEEHPDTATSYNNIASNLNALGKYDESQKLFEKALELRSKLLGREHPGTAASYNSIAFNLIAQDKREAAQAILKQGIHSFEASRLTSAAGINRASLRTANPRFLLAALQAKEDPLAAWTSVEFSLARGLLDQRASRSGTTLTVAELAEQRKLRKQIVGLQGQVLDLLAKNKRTNAEAKSLDSLLAERRATEERLVALAVTESERSVASPETIQQSLAPDAALLFWVDLAHTSWKIEEHWACIVRRTGQPKWIRMPGSGPGGAWTKEDNELPAKLRRSLSVRPALVLEKIIPEIEKLRAQRITPLRDELVEVKTLHVVPVHLMAGVPVEVLAPEFTISYVPSGTFLARLPKRLERPATLLALGDPVYKIDRKRPPSEIVLRGVGRADIPASRFEIAQIADLFGPGSRRYFDADASEQTVNELRKKGELEKYRYLHFATHGEGNDARAFESSLILSQDNLPKAGLPPAGEPYINGQLSAREVLDFWKLDAELVTLSACETAIGRQGGGDGLLGFAQAFLLAGSRSVSVSLWKVDDTASALLMIRFYENLLGKREGMKPIPKAKALAEAKQWLRDLSRAEADKLVVRMSKDLLVSRAERGPGAKLPPVPIEEASVPGKASDKPYAHPRFWAAFILIGDPN